MKHTRLSLLLVALLLSSAAAAESKPLACKVTLTQTITDFPRKLAPRTSWGRQFGSFSLDLKKSPAWLHQNLCVSKRDFRGASFEGTLCVVLMTAPGTPASGAAVLDVEVSRDAISVDDLPNVTPSSKRYGGVRATVPLDTEGKTFSFTQGFATSGAKGELHDLTISCSAS
jgi:hypothetical protein